MCHAFLTDTNFYQLLFRIDQSIAEEVRERGCECGGVLHAAPYPRKPRGVRSALDDSYQSRLSFCCSQDGCRRRHTPASVRFLGRKVYLGVIVVLITALSSVSTKFETLQASLRGSIIPVTNRLHYPDPRVAPLTRSANGSFIPVTGWLL